MHPPIEPYKFVSTNIRVMVQWVEINSSTLIIMCGIVPLNYQYTTQNI
jgi:hypothetical protein